MLDPTTLTGAFEGATQVLIVSTEEQLSRIGVPVTSLRNGFYANTVVRLLGPALETGELVAPADGPVSWTAHADLAEAAAIILTEEGWFTGATPPLTAPCAYNLDDIAGMLTELTGRSIIRVVADDDDWTKGLAARGVPEDQATMSLSMFRASRRGEFAATDPSSNTCSTARPGPSAAC